jgi:hypothetical protein
MTDHDVVEQRAFERQRDRERQRRADDSIRVHDDERKAADAHSVCEPDHAPAGVAGEEQGEDVARAEFIQQPASLEEACRSGTDPVCGHERQEHGLLQPREVSATSAAA